uniref:Uncharacterized protein n=1 Tax=Rhizophora mucronata TaxID=61149 RepID=A0A2P2NVC9_RHIMU
MLRATNYIKPVGYNAGAKQPTNYNYNINKHFNIRRNYKTANRGPKISRACVECHKLNI